MPIYCVDKPLGATSHDVVARARRLLGTRKVGHAGTLDPLATGVLLVLAGEATKLSGYLTGHDKTYLAWVAFGATTPTLDAEGPIGLRGDPATVDESSVRAALPPFLALTVQRPPAFSAIKQAGQRSYAAARRGDVIEPPSRPAAYRAITLLAFSRSRSQLPGEFAPNPPDAHGLPVTTAASSEPETPSWRPQAGGRTFDLPERLDDEDAPFPTALLSLTVAAGTYVRAFARDLGTALGVPAHLSGLVRVASGAVDLSAAGELESLPNVEPVSATAALGLPLITLTDPDVAAVRQGKRPPVNVTTRSALVDAAGGLVALVEPRGSSNEPHAGADSYDLLRVFN